MAAGNRVDLTAAFSNFNCTLNFGGFRRSAGKKYHYQLSAGHCLDDFRDGYGASYNMPVRAPFGRIGRVQGNQFPEDITGEDGEEVEESGNTDSMAVFLLPQSRRSSRIRLETRSGRVQYFRVVDRLDDMREGDTLCQYGHETGFTACGEVDETNVSDPQGKGTTITSLVIIDMFQNCTIIDGDSGGPVFDSRADGVLAGALIQGFTRSTLCGEDPEVEGLPAQDAAGQRVWVSPLEHALDAFGFNLTVAR